MREMDDEEEKAAAETLGKLLGNFVGVELDDYAVAKIDEAIAFHRGVYIRRGLKFPNMVAIVLPSIRQIDIVRADLDQGGVQVVVVNLTRKYPDVTAKDIAYGVGRVFPDYMRRALEAGMANKKRILTLADVGL